MFLVLLLWCRVMCVSWYRCWLYCCISCLKVVVLLVVIWCVCLVLLVCEGRFGERRVFIGLFYNEGGFYGGMKCVGVGVFFGVF